jgi:hypothetical protein
MYLTPSTLSRQKAHSSFEVKGRVHAAIRLSYSMSTDIDANARGSRDVFISYAREDQAFATKLRKALERRGLTVWQDSTAIRVGDSLSETIRRGIEQARYGIVILSPYFLAKDWTQRELRWLSALETDGRKVVLPLWHGVSVPDVKSFSPVLADRAAVNSSEGLRAVVTQLMKELVGAWVPHTLEWPSGLRAVVLPLRRGSRAVVLGQFNVTNAQYQVFCQEMKIKQPSGKIFSGSRTNGVWRGPFTPWDDPAFRQSDAPVVCVTLSQARRFCAWVNRQLPRHSRAELPSVDVWRRAVMAGGDLTSDRPRSGSSGPLTLSETVDTNAWGVIGLTGNVWQWAIDEPEVGLSLPSVVGVARPTIKKAATPVIKKVVKRVAASVVSRAVQIQRHEVEDVWLCGGSYLDDLAKIKWRLPAAELEDGARTAHADVGFRIGGTVAIDTLPLPTRRRLAEVPDLTSIERIMWRVS